VSADRKNELLDRTKKLIEAVKFARATANETPVTQQSIGKPIFDFLFK
jgi:hypothetical protein